MAEPSNKIPDYFSRAFHEVIWRYENWSPSIWEITVRIIGAPYPMSAVCGFMDKFNDPLPEAIFKQLDGYMDAQHQELKEKLGKEPTYSVGGYCLLQLIDERKADHAKRMSMLPPVNPE
jgi:hypothetical protein